MSGATSAHFQSRELECPHCGVNGCEQELVDVLEDFRAAVKQAVIVDSAYRCPVHNAAIGGAPRSEHMFGMAADIRVVGMSGGELEAVARTIPEIHGIGRSDYVNYLHVDVRPSPAQWCYAEDGKQEPYYPPTDGGISA